MRKLVTIAILLMYTLSSSGTSLYLHLCCGLPHVLAVNEQLEDNDPCSFCEETDHHREADCEDDMCELGANHHGCQDVYVNTVDVTAEHITHIDKFGQPLAPPVAIALPWSERVSPFVAERLVFSFTDSSPPGVLSTPLFIFHCTYLI